MPRITFFAGSRELGTYECPVASSQDQRHQIARDNGIDFYTMFVLDDGRVVGWVDDNGLLINYACNVAPGEYNSTDTLLRSFQATYRPTTPPIDYFDGNRLNTNTMDEQNNVSQDNYARSVGGPMNSTPIGRPTFPGDYPRPPAERVPTVKRNKARQIQIAQVDHGYLVNVGCQTLVFENMDTLIKKLTAYLKDPNTVEKKWMTEGVL